MKSLLLRVLNNHTVISNPDGLLMTDHKLTHLKELEAESIHIIREVAAEFEHPVMLYSVGKDSAVMLHLTMKAFFPGILLT